MVYCKMVIVMLMVMVMVVVMVMFILMEKWQAVVQIPNGKSQTFSPISLSCYVLCLAFGATVYM